MRLTKLEYVWLDGNDKVGLRSKSRNVNIKSDNPQAPPTIDNIIEHAPDWSFDGSSTSQAETKLSDLILKPVKIFPNPFAGQNPNNAAFIVLCEVYDLEGNPHASNTRAILRESYSNNKNSHNTIFSAEQEFVFWNPKENWPADWGDNGDLPEPQGSRGAALSWQSGCGEEEGIRGHLPRVPDQKRHQCARRELRRGVARNAPKD